ncbi:hypothetical protein [Lysinibacillus fusiformis]|uniref:Uncharacterized protein n=1 Tax=Lysinibacillus fusiformis TaxID=28031 RepID=A0A1E4QYR4_9BACI|nr:hypothetical protein [Lysinibacillus fusiformis]MBD8523932.1 hypothetical protein [Lysinibacillus fusiformis]ODV53319.1 hypothetical protein BG258_23750 [Lysinibacillus fusiformis]
MAQTILHKRGLKASLPELLESEIAFTKDTREVFIGTNEGNKRLLTEDNNHKIVVFVVSGDVAEGVQDPHIVLPYDVEVLDVKAYVATQPGADLQFQLEYSIDYTNWSPLTVDPIQINSGSFGNNGGHELSVRDLLAETMLRINVIASSVEARNLTVNIKTIRK